MLCPFQVSPQQTPIPSPPFASKCGSPPIYSLLSHLLASPYAEATSLPKTKGLHSH